MLITLNKIPCLKLISETVIQDGLALMFVKEQTPENCLEVLEYNARALQFVKKQTVTYDIKQNW